MSETKKLVRSQRPRTRAEGLEFAKYRKAWLKFLCRLSVVTLQELPNAIDGGAIAMDMAEHIMRVRNEPMKFLNEVWPVLLEYEPFLDSKKARDAMRDGTAKAWAYKNAYDRYMGR